MFNQKKLKLSIKLSIVIVSIILLIGFMPSVFSKYETIGTSGATASIAFYLLEENYYSRTLKLTDLLPSNSPYIYTFTVSNNNGSRRTEVALEYDLSIVATTNLPLTFDLYMNEAYNNPNSTSAIVSNTVSTDDDGTYFRNIIATNQTFDINSDKTNTYYLIINFPDIYNDAIYQDISELIAININSRQII